MTRNVGPIVAVVIALALGGIGVAQGSSHPPGPSAHAAQGKKSHKLSVDYKTGIIDVIGEGEGGADVTFTDEAKLKGRPFGSRKAFVSERDLFTYNNPPTTPQTDFSGTHHVTFSATVRGNSASDDGKFRGFYDWAVDANGDPSGTILGEITGGSGKFKGAKGSFTVLNLFYFTHDPARLAGQWEGSIRY